MAVSSAIDRHDLPGALSAYARVRESDGDDTALLTRLAELLLEIEASGDDADRRDAALHQLALAGTAGRSTLERLGQTGSVHALAILAESGSGSARTSLRAHVDDPDPDVRAAAVLGLAIDSDRARLLALAAESSARVRAAAVGRLGELAPESEARAVLEERARIDPDPSVRGAAVGALGAFGTPALAILRERLSDPIASVRTTAVASLLRADRSAAREVLASLLAMPPSAQGIEAARLLATPAGGVAPAPADASASRAYLGGALAATDVALRSQAAIALSTLPTSPDVRTALAQALGREQDGMVKLAVARAILAQASDDASALEAVRALASAEVSMTTLQAAILLATRNESAGVERLEQVMHGADIPLRRVAARALARDAMQPQRAAAALEDPDPEVRIQAAGGIVAAAAASE